MPCSNESTPSSRAVLRGGRGRDSPTLTPNSPALAPNSPSLTPNSPAGTVLGGGRGRHAAQGGVAASADCVYRAAGPLWGPPLFLRQRGRVLRQQQPRPYGGQPALGGAARTSSAGDDPRSPIRSYAGYILPPPLRLVLMLGIHCLPSCDWFSRWVYTASPPAIGSHAGYILPPLLRLVFALGIYCLPSRDWFSRWVYTASPPAIGSYTGYYLPQSSSLATPALAPPSCYRNVTYCFFNVTLFRHFTGPFCANYAKGVVNTPEQPKTDSYPNISTQTP
eukprot:1189444-Prorocentrum_minimum.AAC.1